MRSPTLSVTATDTGGRGIQFYSDFYLTLPQTSTLTGRRRKTEDHGKARATITAKGEMRSRKKYLFVIYPLTSFLPYFMDIFSSFWPIIMDQELGALKLSV